MSFKVDFNFLPVWQGAYVAYVHSHWFVMCRAPLFMGCRISSRVAEFALFAEFWYFVAKFCRSKKNNWWLVPSLAWWLTTSWKNEIELPKTVGLTNSYHNTAKS